MSKANWEKKVEDYYKDIAGVDGLSSLQKLLLYPSTLMNNNVLSIFTGVATGLSINILTNFLDFNKDNLVDFFLLLAQLIVAIIFNVALIYFTIKCSTFRESIPVNRGIESRPDREKQYKEDLIKAYKKEYKKFRKSFIITCVSFLMILVLVIIVPTILLICEWVGIL